MFQIKPIYTIKEIAEMLKMPKKQARDTLIKLNVPLHATGKQGKLLIFLSELQENAPNLWQSLLAAQTQQISEIIELPEVETTPEEEEASGWDQIKFSKESQ